MTPPKIDPNQMILDPNGLKSLKTTKRISSSGDSYIVPITKEAKALGLEKGEEITIIFENPYSSNTHDYDLARMLANPNASYVNSRILTPDDRYIDGTPIEDLTEQMSEEDMIRITTQLEVWSRFYYDITSTTRHLITSKFAEYSDSQRSFVQKFRSPRIHAPHSELMEVYAALELLDELTVPDTFGKCSLDSVNSLLDHILRAKTHARKVCMHLQNAEEPEEGLSDLIAELNQDWEMHTTGKKYPDSWYVGVAMIRHYTDEEMEDDYDWGDNPIFKGIPEFKMYKGPNPVYVSDQLHHDFCDPNVGLGTAVSTTVLGPFESEDVARDVLSFLRIEHKRLGTETVGVDFIDRCEKEIDKLFKN